MSDDTTPNLALPYIMPSQAQKHVTHNEAIRALDAVVQLMVASRELASPPMDPSNGDRYIVGAGATGTWMGHDGKIAAFQDGAWAIYPPVEGWVAWVADEDSLLAWDGDDWVRAAGNPNPVPLVGVNVSADVGNRLAVASAASLFTHEGAGHRLKINKADAGETASVLFQTGYAGRAEIGTTGDDVLRIKVSTDGDGWHDALVVAPDQIALIGETVTVMDSDATPLAMFDTAGGEVDVTQAVLRGRRASFAGSPADDDDALVRIAAQIEAGDAALSIAVDDASHGDSLALAVQSDQPGALTSLFQHNDTSGLSTAHARSVHRVLAGGGGDAFASFEKSGGSQWSIGYRNSENVLRIANAGNLASGVKVELRANRIDLLEPVRVNRISGKNHDYGTVWFGGTDENGGNSTVGVGGNSAPEYGVVVRADGYFAWSNNPGAAATPRDLVLRRDAAGAMALRNGTSAQTFRVYETFTNASNFERASLSCAGDTVTLAAESAGTGSANMDVALAPAGAGRVKFGTHTALGSETVTGYIVIKDSSGTERKLAVVS